MSNAKPWANEFVNDDSPDMDDAACEILLANLRRGRSTRKECLGHEPNLMNEPQGATVYCDGSCR